MNKSSESIKTLSGYKKERPRFRAGPFQTKVEIKCNVRV
jgi:hypothetical protein